MAVIDCDVHNAVPSIEALFPYLEPHWRDYASHSHFRGPTDTAYPPAPTSAGPGTKPEKGPPGSDLGLVQRHLDEWGAEVAILNCAYAVEGIHNPDLDVAVARATNDWQIEHWLDRDPRLRASIVVPIRQPEQAAREVERVGGHPGFVQVFLPVRSGLPYGKREYHPLYAAAVKHGLVVGLEFGGAPGNPPTSVGWPSYYIEEYAGMAQAYQSQLMSMIVEGVFDRFPELRVTCVESGFTWLAPFLWRFDKDWKGLRREVPWNDRLPSAYVRDHVRFTLQPVDGPADDPARLLKAIEGLGSDEMLMFSTDYPHWQFDGPAEAVPAGLPESLGRKIMSENARSWYRLS